MDFFVLGASHNECPVEIRETLHFSPKDAASFLEVVRQDGEINECMILSTCNRVEFWGVMGKGSFPEEKIFELLRKERGLGGASFQPYFYRHEGKAAIHHFLRVAAGLDSLVVGENEILGQIREAFRLANEARTVHSLLYRLMEKSLKLGKDVRTKTKINEGATSIPSVAVELAEKIFGKLTGEKVMVIGTGEMSELTLKNLKNAGAEIMYVVSRNQEKGEALAASFSAAWIPLEAWAKNLSQVDILITSTAAPHAVVRYEEVKAVMSARRSHPLFMIDIAVPRDIEASVNSIDDVYLYNIDDLKGVAASNLRLRRQEIHEAESLVDRALLDFQGWVEALKAQPTLERFESFVNEILEKEMAELGGRLDETHRNQLRDRIRAKLMHPAREKIKEASQNGGVTRYLEALHSLFALDPKQAKEDDSKAPSGKR